MLQQPAEINRKLPCIACKKPNTQKFFYYSCNHGLCKNCFSKDSSTCCKICSAITAKNESSNKKIKLDKVNGSYDSIMATLSSELKKLETNLDNGANLIQEHCFNLRRKIKILKETKQIELNSIAEILTTRVNEYETARTNSYQLLNKNNFRLYLNKLKNDLVRLEAKAKETPVDAKSINEIKEIETKLEFQQYKLKQFIFDFEILDFKENSFKIDEKLFGNLELEAIDINKYHSFDISAPIRNLETTLNATLRKISNIFYLDNQKLIISINFSNGENFLFLFDENIAFVKHLKIESENFFTSSNRICYMNADTKNSQTFYKIRILNDSLDLIKEYNVAFNDDNLSLLEYNNDTVYLMKKNENVMSNLIVSYNLAQNLFVEIGQQEDPEKPFYFYSNRIKLMNGELNSRAYMLQYDLRSLTMMEKQFGSILYEYPIKNIKKIFIDSKNGQMKLLLANFNVMFYRLDGIFIKQIKLNNINCIDNLFFGTNGNICYFDSETLKLKI